MKILSAKDVLKNTRFVIEKEGEPGEIYVYIEAYFSSKKVGYINLRQIKAGMTHEGLPRNVRWLYADRLWVSPAYRSSGIGSKLLKMAQNYAKAHNFSIYLTPATRNYNRLIKYYEARGFKEGPGFMGPTWRWRSK